MNVLIMNAPHVPSYFNAGHHWPIFETAAYLRRLGNGVQVDCMDAGALIFTWKEIGDRLFSGKYDLIAVMLDFDTSDNLERLLRYIRELSPESKLIFFGRLCKRIPDFFQQYEVDAIVFHGDDESGVSQYLRFLRDANHKPSGCMIRESGAWHQYAGEYLPSDEWAFPDLDEIPFRAYYRLYLNEANKFCGLPRKRELVAHVSRGCPFACPFCDVWEMQGKQDRRLTPKRLVSYIRSAMRTGRFDYVSMYSPVFTLSPVWTEEFCDRMRLNPSAWKCVTTAACLSPSMISKMARAGCVRISIGVESLYYSDVNAPVPQAKRCDEEMFGRIAVRCAEERVELNCFIMLGVPGTSTSDCLRTVRKLREYGVRIRPTAYTPYHEMRGEMKLADIGKFNRQLLNATFPENEKQALYGVLFGGKQADEKNEKSRLR